MSIIPILIAASAFLFVATWLLAASVYCLRVEVSDELDACDTEAERVKTQMKAIAKRRKKAKGRLKTVGMKAKNFDAARACSKLPPDVRDEDDQEIVYIRKVLDCSPQADLFATLQ